MAEYNDAAVMVSLHLLQTNTGQLEGVPENPRLIKNQEFEDLKRSILVFPQMLELRPIVYAGDYIALGGNQRRGALTDIAQLTYKQIAAKLNKLDEFTSKTDEDKAVILEYWQKWCADKDKPVPTYNASHLSAEQMAEFVIKDNVQFGENDWAILANEWDMERVKSWGMEIPADWVNPADLSDDFTLPSGDKNPFTQITFTLTDKQADEVKKMLSKVKKYAAFKECQFDNTNSNANALHYILTEIAGKHKDLTEIEADENGND